jgi:hypothetical protein
MHPKPLNTRKRVRAYIFGFGLLALLAGSHQLLWGKLYPYSPFKPGFTRHELPNMIVYLQEGSTFTCGGLDSVTAVVEERHGLRFTHKPELLIFSDSVSYLRRSITRARFYAYPNGVLVVSPWAVREASEGKISMPIYLTHELSHTLLYQHMSLASAYFFSSRWFLEGVAVYNANQMGTSWYPSKAETYAYIRQGNFIPPEWFGTAKEEQVTLHVKYPSTFAYCESACIIDYLNERFGRQLFAKYQAQMLERWQPETVFLDVYGVEWSAFLEEFKAHVHQ